MAINVAITRRVKPAYETEFQAARRELSDLEAWFRGTSALPPRWKMAVAASMVAVLTWLVIPRMTRVSHGWLHSTNPATNPEELT